MESTEIKDAILLALEDIKAIDITTLDVRGMTSLTDFMIIASGRSNRHVSSIAEHVAVELKTKGVTTLGIEGEDVGEWVLVDFGDVILHVMQPEVRDYYQLERLWSVPV